MNMNIMDAITELETTLKKQNTILESFMNEYVIGTQKEVAFKIDTRFEQYQLTAQVVADLMFEAKEQAAKLEALASAEM